VTTVSSVTRGAEPLPVPGTVVTWTGVQGLHALHRLWQLGGLEPRRDLSSTKFCNSPKAQSTVTKRHGTREATCAE
jgi:hypothetical protein